MNVQVWHGTETEPDWWRTSRVGMVHDVTIVRTNGDGHGCRYVFNCSCHQLSGCEILLENAENYATKHLDYVRAIDAPDGAERTAILRGAR